MDRVPRLPNEPPTFPKSPKTKLFHDTSDSNPVVIMPKVPDVLFYFGASCIEPQQQIHEPPL
eukprot:7326947-Pyramimonas_sp.AAC.1